jgi:hypothetical protein
VPIVIGSRYKVFNGQRDSDFYRKKLGLKNTYNRYYMLCEEASGSSWEENPAERVFRKLESALLLL